MCHFIAGRYEEGAEDEHRAVELRPHFVTAWRTYAASAGMAGDRDVAAYALSQAKPLQPSLSVEWVERYHGIVCLEDRNGAGKSTLMKAITDVHKPNGGVIRFNGVELNGKEPGEIRRLGVEMIYQDLALAKM